MMKMQHVAMRCLDRKAQELFYARHFGFRRARVFNPGTHKEFVILRLGELCLELFQASPKAAEARAAGEGVGFPHLAFETADLEAVVARLKADGVETERIVDCSQHVEGMRVCFLDDPEGNRLELMEGYCDQEDPPELETE